METTVTVRRDGRTRLKKQLGGVNIILRIIVGSGISVSHNDVLREAGSVGLSLVVWGSLWVLAMLGEL